MGKTAVQKTGDNNGFQTRCICQQLKGSRITCTDTFAVDQGSISSKGIIKSFICILIIIFLGIFQGILIINNGITQILVDCQLLLVVRHLLCDDLRNDFCHLSLDFLLLSCLLHSRIFIGYFDCSSLAVDTISVNSKDQWILKICLQQCIIRIGKIFCLRKIGKINVGCSTKHTRCKIL